MYVRFVQNLEVLSSTSTWGRTNPTNRGSSSRMPRRFSKTPLPSRLSPPSVFPPTVCNQPASPAPITISAWPGEREPRQAFSVSCFERVRMKRSPGWRTMFPRRTSSIWICEGVFACRSHDCTTPPDVAFVTSIPNANAAACQAPQQAYAHHAGACCGSPPPKATMASTHRPRFCRCSLTGRVAHERNTFTARRPGVARSTPRASALTREAGCSTAAGRWRCTPWAGRPPKPVPRPGDTR